jgi:hypothetical protein
VKVITDCEDEDGERPVESWSATTVSQSSVLDQVESPALNSLQTPARSSRGAVRWSIWRSCSWRLSRKGSHSECNSTSHKALDSRQYTKSVLLLGRSPGISSSILLAMYDIMWTLRTITSRSSRFLAPRSIGKGMLKARGRE